MRKKLRSASLYCRRGKISVTISQPTIDTKMVADSTNDRMVVQVMSAVTLCSLSLQLTHEDVPLSKGLDRAASDRVLSKIANG